MKLPIEIQKIKDPDGMSRLRAIISFPEAVTHTRLSQTLIQIQNEYTEFVKECGKLLKKIHSSRKCMSDSKLQWKLANRIYSFIKWVENNGCIFANISEAIPRDIDLSKSQLNYLIKFRTYYSAVDDLHEEINWSKYRELLDIRNLKVRKSCEEKILSGEIKTDHDIREFKKRRREGK